MSRSAKYFSRNIVSHKPYLPGIQPADEEEVIKLNTNENPYPPSPHVKDAVLAELESLRLYPNPPSGQLRKALSDLHGLNQDQVIIGNGSDDVLNLCTRCFADESLSVGMLEPSYSLYEVIASLQGADLHRIPFADDSFSIDPEAVVDSGANLFFITSPHAPSGREYDQNCLRRVVESFDGIVVIDEAYADFATQNAIGLLDEFHNLIITRTLSKSYSLAGMRVGYGLSSPELVSVLDEAREVYNVDRLAQAGAWAALTDRAYFKSTCAKITEEREKLRSLLQEWGWKTCPSGANFLFTLPVDFYGRTGQEVAGNLYEYLASRKILTRYFPHHELTSSYLRISIGNSRDMDILVERLIEWKTQEQQ